MHQGCPICKLPKGELKILNILERYNTDYISQHKFNDLNLVFDFYLPKLNILIEYDGIQHFEPINHFGGIKSFISQKNRDEVKNQYCSKKNIKLFRIKYTDNIEESIIRIINLHDI
jgi:very-short-patch-repair endonuclease